MSFATRYATLRASLSIAAAIGISVGIAMSSVAFAQAPARPGPAQAQQARPGATAQAPQTSGPLVVQVKPAGESQVWNKQCGRDEVNKAESCVTIREFVSESNQPALAVAVYDIKTAKGNERQVRFLLPLMLALDTGVRFSVDSAGYIPGKFQVCMPNGCFAMVPVQEDMLKMMKSGKTFNVAVRNAGGSEIVFAIPADGFGKAFDGPAVDPEVVAERQKMMEQEIQRTSEQMRKDLEARGASGLPAPAPAPVAPKQ